MPGRTSNALSAGSSGGLTPTAVKTANYTAVAGDLVRVDTTGGPITVTLPAAAAGATVGVKLTTLGGSNAVTIAAAGSDVFNKAGGSTTLTLSLLNQGVVLAAISGVWVVQADDLALAQLDARYTAAVSVIGASNGATDAARFNAAFAALGAGGGTVQGKAGQTYVLEASIVIPSNCTLDISGCVITRGGSFTSGPLIRNTSVMPLRTVTDAAITSGSPTLTSATANFTTADIGQQVQVMGAGSVTRPLYATITARTNSTTVTLSLAAAATVSGATCNVYKRDTAIGLIGNAQTFIQGGSNVPPLGTTANPIGHMAATVLLRRIDGLVADLGMGRINFTAGSSLVKIGDVTNLDCRRWVAAQNPAIPSADLIHITGPCSRFRIGELYGDLTDDIVGVTMGDWSPLNDVSGDVTDGVIENIHPSTCGGNVVLLAGADNSAGTAACKLRNITVRNLTAPSCNVGVGIGSVGGGTPGILDAAGITLEKIAVVTAAGFPAVTVSGGVADLLIDGIRWASGSGAGTPSFTSAAYRPVVELVGGSGPIIVRNVIIDQGDWLDVVKVVSGSIKKLTVENVFFSTVATSANVNVVGLWGSNVPKIVIRGVRGFTSANSMVIYAAQPTSTVEYLLLEEVDWNNALGLVVLDSSTSSVADPHVTLRDVRAGNVSRGVSTKFSTTVRLSGVDFVSAGGTYLVGNVAGGAVRVLADGATIVTGAAAISNTGGGTISVDGKLSVDVSALTPSDGDMTINTNGALGCGTGRVIYNTAAAKWKHLYTGLTT